MIRRTTIQRETYERDDLAGTATENMTTKSSFLLFSFSPTAAAATSTKLEPSLSVSSMDMQAATLVSGGRGEEGKRKSFSAK